MDAKKVIAICQSGGEFVTNKDGSLSYSGGEAYALDIDHQTQLQDFKSELADMFNCIADTMTLKYFLPGNKKTLITISKDKDLQRMLNFLGDSSTAEIFIMSEEAAARNVSNMPASRSSRTTVSEAVVPVVEGADVAVETGTVTDQNNLSAYETPLRVVPPGSSNDTHRKAAQQWENTITGVDQRFNSFSEFREALHKYSIAHGFAYRYKKNDSHRVTVKCKSQGCPWRIYASRLSTTQLVCIKKMHAHHTCEGAAVKAGYRATRGWVGSIIKEKLKVSPNYKPKDIASDIKREYGIQLNYSQAWRAKEIAREQLQGSYKEAYTQLPSFCEKIKETNPGSVATFTTKEDSSFHRLFVSFHACIVGFQQGCRPLIFLDSTPLNSKYQGVLLSATAADGNDGIFPVAFAVVDAETDDNWHWFLMELNSTISLTSQQITFVADFHDGLKKSLAEVFDKCYHGYCVRHLAEKLNRDLKGQFSHEARRFLINDFYAAAYSPKLEGFQRSVENIKGISPDAYNWVIQSEPDHWANAFFGGTRYNLMTSGFGQNFYSWVSGIKDDGGGMSPEAMRRCMSFGFTDKKAKTAIGRYGNGFKTSTMRLGADVIVFSRHIDNRIFTQSIGLLSYTFLRKTGKDRIVVPMVHYEFNAVAEKLNYLQGKEHFMSNLETILKWAPFSTETELLQQFDDIGPHGTKVVIYNLWFTDDGIEEFDFNTDPKDIRISGDAKSVDTLPAWKKLNEQHIGNQFRYSLRVYLSILYLRLPETFRIILRGEVVKHHNIADDLKYLDYILYKPQCGGGVEAQVVTTIGYLKEAPQLIIHGFNVYHKNRLILPFWQVVRFIDNKGRGIVGILEANFVEPTHNKQDFEKTSLFQKLETRLKEMTMEYFDHHCALVGYQVKTKPKRQLTSLVSNGDAPIILDHNPAPIGFTEVALGRPRSEQSLSNSQSRYEQGLHTKRKELGNFDNAVKSKRQAVQGANASDHGQLLASELENQEAANLMQINQQLRAKCLEYEKEEEELELKVIQLKGEIEEVENEYKRLLAESEAMEVTKTEKNV